MPPQRQMTPAELLSAARRMKKRLTRALDAMDAGDADALDDLAGAVRTTLCFGKGDKLLLRLCNIFRVEYPTFVVPDTDVPPDASYRIGPLPEPRSEDAVGAVVPFPDLMNAQAVRVPGVGARTWNQVLVDFGNTYGAHVSTTVPELLDEIRAYGVAGGTMGAHLMRAAGIVAEHGLAQVLAEIDEEEAPVAREKHSGDVHIGMMALTKDGVAQWSMSCTAEKTVELFSMPVFDQRRMTGVWHWDAASETGTLNLDWTELES